jgi:hypothetical protein
MTYEGALSRSSSEIGAIMVLYAKVMFEFLGREDAPVLGAFQIEPSFSRID